MQPLKEGIEKSKRTNEPPETEKPNIKPPSQKPNIYKEKKMIRLKKHRKKRCWVASRIAMGMVIGLIIISTIRYWV